jgi:hypothetical protein
MGTARKSLAPGSEAPPKLAPEKPGKAKAHVSVQGSPEWRDWCVSYAAYKRTDLAQLIDALLAESARRDGFEEAPSRR